MDVVTQENQGAATIDGTKWAVQSTKSINSSGWRYMYSTNLSIAAGVVFHMAWLA
jgi:hypothetical protein